MDGYNLSEKEARALWERAARLQAEAAARELSPAEDEDESDGVPRRAGEYSVEVVRRAAEEAGISPEFVDRALEEASVDGKLPARVDGCAERFLGDGPRTTRVTGVMEGSIEQVFESLQRVIPNPPFGFTLLGTRGGPPLNGGTLVFEVPYYGATNSLGSPSKPVMDIRHWADIKELFVRLAPLPEEEGEARTELQLWASTAHARRVNFWTGSIFAGLAGVGAGLAGFFVSGGLLELAATAELVAQLGAGAASGLAGVVGVGKGTRSLFRLGQRKGHEGLQRVIQAVRVDLHTGGGFLPSQAARPAGDDTLSGLLGGLGL
jgi:hypothetical protein